MSGLEPERTEPRAEAQEAEAPGIPYSITPQIDVRPQEDGSLAVFFGRSLHVALRWVLGIAALVGALGTWLLWLLRADGGLVWLLGSVTVLGVGLAFTALWRTTGVIARPGSLLMRIEWLPGVGIERKFTGAEIESIRRCVSLRLAGTSVYQLRAQLRGGESVVVGHGISDKVEAASIASALERALG